MLAKRFWLQVLVDLPFVFFRLTVTEGEGRFSTNAGKEKEDRIISGFSTSC